MKSEDSEAETLRIVTSGGNRVRPPFEVYRASFASSSSDLEYDFLPLVA